ncbi:MAG TPA: VWA domain-containing protein [Bryobacteraceae bacterium]|nr:VWA domain-containing protein [Bryobacteraceae bacterium]
MRPVLALLTAATLAVAQDDTPLFRTGVSLVKVDVEVQDTRGSGVTGLRAGDFVVYDEEARQTIADFAAESEPIRVLMLLDVSPSMSRWLGDLGAKSTEALRALRPQDEVALMTFATRSQLVQPLTAEKKDIGKLVIDNIYKQMLGRETLVNEALVEAARYMRAQPGKARRAVLVVTDNESVRRSVSNDEVVRALHAGDIVLSAILVGEKPGGATFAPARYQPPDPSTPDVQRFVAETGGEVITGAAPAAALQPVLKGLTTRYSFQYTAPSADEGAFRKIRVELTPEAAARNPGVKLKARSGYTVGAAATK